MAAKFQFESTAITALASQYEVIIIGSGRSGLVSAVQVHELGLKPVILEKMGKIGGNTTRASSGMNAAGEVVSGLHGNNRIGGNSIAETVVFGCRAGRQVYRNSMTS